MYATASRGSRVFRARPDPKAHKVSRVRLGHRASRDRKDLRVLKVKWVFRGHRVSKVHREYKVRQDRRVTPVHKAIQGKTGLRAWSELIMSLLVLTALTVGSR
jgi:hypothetical protein